MARVEKPAEDQSSSWGCAWFVTRPRLGARRGSRRGGQRRVRSWSCAGALLVWYWFGQDFLILCGNTDGVRTVADPGRTQVTNRAPGEDQDHELAVRIRPEDHDGGPGARPRGPRPATRTPSRPPTPSSAPRCRAPGPRAPRSSTWGWAVSGARSAPSGRSPASSRPPSATRVGSRPSRATRRRAPGMTGHTEIVLVAYDPDGRLRRRPAAHLLGVARPDAGVPAGQRRRHHVPLGDLHHHARAGARRTQHP